LHRGLRAGWWIVDNEIGKSAGRHFEASWEADVSDAAEEESWRNRVWTLEGEASTCGDGGGKGQEEMMRLLLGGEFASFARNA
jgi:hypothetical protein